MNANVIIIGGGPAGIITAFDDEFCDQIYEVLIKAGVKVHTGSRVVSIDGNKTVFSLHGAANKMGLFVRAPFFSCRINLEKPQN